MLNLARALGGIIAITCFTLIVAAIMACLEKTITRLTEYRIGLIPPVYKG